MNAIKSFIFKKHSWSDVWFSEPWAQQQSCRRWHFSERLSAGSCDLGEWQGRASQRFMYSPTEMPWSIWALNDSFPKSHNPMKILDSTCKIPSKVDFLNKYVTTISEFYFQRSFFNLNFHNDIFIIIKWQEIDAGSLNFIILNVTGMARISKRQKKCFN